MRCENLTPLVEAVRSAPQHDRAETLVTELRERCDQLSPALDGALSRWLDHTAPRPDALEVLCQGDPSLLDDHRRADRGAYLRSAAAACDLLATNLFDTSTLQRVTDVEAAATGFAVHRGLQGRVDVLPYVARNIGMWLAGLPDDADRRVDRSVYGEAWDVIGDQVLASSKRGEPLVQSCATFWWLDDDIPRTKRRGDNCETEGPHLLLIDIGQPAQKILSQVVLLSDKDTRIVTRADDAPTRAPWHDHTPLRAQPMRLLRVPAQAKFGTKERVVIRASVDQYVVQHPEASTTWSQLSDAATFLESIGAREVVVVPARDLGWFSLFETMNGLHAMLPTVDMAYGLTEQD